MARGPRRPSNLFHRLATPSSTATLPPVWFRDTRDALIAIQGIRDGSIPLLRRRPSSDEGEALCHSGAIVAFIEEDSGISRWTDTLRPWSPSRMSSRSASYLAYRQFKRGIPKGTRCHSDIAYETGSLEYDVYCCLTDESVFLPGGLMKKCMTAKLAITHLGPRTPLGSLHIISYYQPEKALSGELPTLFSLADTHPGLRSMQNIDADILTASQAWRAPPLITLDSQGLPLYLAETSDPTPPRAKSRRPIDRLSHVDRTRDARIDKKQPRDPFRPHTRVPTQSNSPRLPRASRDPERTLPTPLMIPQLPKIKQAVQTSPTADDSELEPESEDEHDSPTSEHLPSRSIDFFITTDEYLDPDTQLDPFDPSQNSSPADQTPQPTQTFTTRQSSPADAPDSANSTASNSSFFSTFSAYSNPKFHGSQHNSSRSRSLTIASCNPYSSPSSSLHPASQSTPHSTPLQRTQSPTFDIPVHHPVPHRAHSFPNLKHVDALEEHSQTWYSSYSQQSSFPPRYTRLSSVERPQHPSPSQRRLIISVQTVYPPSIPNESFSPISPSASAPHPFAYVPPLQPPASTHSHDPQYCQQTSLSSSAPLQWSSYSHAYDHEPVIHGSETPTATTTVPTPSYPYVDEQLKYPSSYHYSHYSAPSTSSASPYSSQSTAYYTSSCATTSSSPLSGVMYDYDNRPYSPVSSTWNLAGGVGVAQQTQLDPCSSLSWYTHPTYPSLIAVPHVGGGTAAMETEMEVDILGQPVNVPGPLPYDIRRVWAE